LHAHRLTGIVQVRASRARSSATPSRGKRDITNTRWLDCKQSAPARFQTPVFKAAGVETAGA
jgi:hypothetical protein